MIHHILVKWNEDERAAALLPEVQALFAGAGEGEGVTRVQLVPNVIDRPNRYDLMIRLWMPAESLPVWDASALHARWKEAFGPRIAKKAIFDADDDCEETKTL